MRNTEGNFPVLDNACDQQIAAKGLSTPQDAAAILLHRLVRRPATTLRQWPHHLIIGILTDRVIRSSMSAWNRLIEHGPKTFFGDAFFQGVELASSTCGG